MLPQHHLLSLVPNRIETAVDRLKQAIWIDPVPLKVEATAPGPRQITLAEAKRLPRRPVRNETFWGRLFDQRWCRIALPALAGPTFLNWRDQGEATLYIDDKPYFGLDVAHRFCRLPAGVRELWIESNCIQSAIWHPEADGMEKGGSYFAGTALCRRNEEAWSAYHDLKCLFDLMLDQRGRENPLANKGLNAFGQQLVVEKATPFYRQLLRALDEVVDAFDRAGIPALREKLAAAYRAFRTDKTFMACALTGHAHIDLVWIWPERMGELKAVHTFATMNRLMEEYPEFRFAYSQPASYEAVQRRAPGLYRDVVKRVRAGQWQATGAMYVESDTLLACGEALARSFTLGQKFFRELNGRPARLNWLPDVFGYSACLPQLMKLAGVDYFFTTKMTWNAVVRFPHSSFIWRGHDGSDVVAHVMQDCGYVTQARVDELKAAMHGHQQADVHHEFLFPTGFGDGGGGTTDEMCERARRLGSLVGMPAMGWDHPEAFFERLEKLRDRLPVHQGECYLEYHRGTFTTHGNLKSTFRGLERVMQLAEAVAAATGQRWEMESAWKKLVFAQFHDYIPGSSVWDVYLEGLPELEKIAADQAAQAGAALSAAKGAWCAFNPHAITVRRRVRHPGTKRDVLVSLPPLSGTKIEDAAITAEPVRVEGRKVSNGLAEFEVTREGWIKSLAIEGNTIPLRGPLGQLALYPDHPANFEAWDIDRQALSLGEIARARADVRPWKEGALAQGFEVERKIGQDSRAVARFFLEAGSPLLHIEMKLDWRESEHLLKIHFPTLFAATNARFGSPFGSVLRSQVAGDLASEAKWEVPFSRWLAIFDEGEAEGLFLVTEAKYGATVRDGDIGLSLVRSPRVTGMEGHGAAYPAHLSRLKHPSRFSDQGRHVIRLALGRHAGDLPRERQPASVADTLFTPPLVYQGRPIVPVLESLEGGETLVPAWVMPLEGKSWLLRLHETAGRRGTVKLRATRGWKMERAGLEGEPQGRIDPRGVNFTPYQIVSVRFSPA